MKSFNYFPNITSLMSLSLFFSYATLALATNPFPRLATAAGVCLIQDVDSEYHMRVKEDDVGISMNVGGGDDNNHVSVSSVVQSERPPLRLHGRAKQSVASGEARDLQDLQLDIARREVVGTNTKVKVKIAGVDENRNYMYQIKFEGHEPVHARYSTVMTMLGETAAEEDDKKPNFTDKLVRQFESKFRNEFRNEFGSDDSVRFVNWLMDDVGFGSLPKVHK